MTILAIDPGPIESALVWFDGTNVLRMEILPNESVLGELVATDADHLAIERVESFGMAVGVEVFETVFYTGRFCEAFAGNFTRINRREIKLHLCGSSRAKDTNVRQALIDRFGPGKDAAVGTKRQPGPLYGIRSHLWSGLAVAVTWWDLYWLACGQTVSECDR